MKAFRKILANAKGATAIEYGLIAALIAVAAIGAMTSLGGQLSTTFDTTAKGFEALVIKQPDGSYKVSDLTMK